MTANAYQDIKTSLSELYLSDERPWLVGFSGGKDSTMLASLIFDAVLSVPLTSGKIRYLFYVPTREWRFTPSLKWLNEPLTRCASARTIMASTSMRIYSGRLPNNLFELILSAEVIRPRTAPSVAAPSV
jgi:hypothetical protein